MNHSLLSRLIFPLDRVFEELNLVNLHQVNRDNQNPSAIEVMIEEFTKSFEAVPEELLSNHYIKNHPQINFKTIVKYRLAGNSWKSLAQQFQINDSRLRMFWYNSIKELTPKLKEYRLEKER